MRDDVLDRLVQPLVNRWGLPVERTARELACAYAALTITASSWAFDLANSSLIGAAVQAALVALLVRGLTTAAGAGPSLLNSPFGRVHMLARVLFLGLSIMSLVQFGLLCAMGAYHLDRALIIEIAQDLSMLCAAGSLYVSVCDQPPPRRRRGIGMARA